MANQPRDKAKAKSRFNQVCPRRLNSLPDSPCPLALERINAIQNQKDKRGKDIDTLRGCSWYCTSSDANYCFFSQINEDPGPYSDEDIAAQLSMTTAQVAKNFELGTAKLRSQKDTEEMQELKESLLDVASRESDNTVYLPDNFIMDRTALQETPATEEDETLEVEETKKKKRTQLYGLYSQQTLKRLKRERDAKKDDQDE